MNLILLFLIVCYCSSMVAACYDNKKIFINELHYENAGTDENEFVEFVVPVGTDVSNFSVHRYCGQNEYLLPMSDGGITKGKSIGGMTVYSVSYPTNGIQNGNSAMPGSAVALVDDKGVVQDFVAYKTPVFVANDGPAAGMKAFALGVAESDKSGKNASIRRIGSGCDCDDFFFILIDRESSKGDVNTLQTFTCSYKTVGL